MHLTNYAINKFSPEFKANKAINEDYMGHKRSYTATIKSMKKMGFDISQL